MVVVGEEMVMGRSGMGRAKRIMRVMGGEGDVDVDILAVWCYISCCRGSEATRVLADLRSEENAKTLCREIEISSELCCVVGPNSG